MRFEKTLSCYPDLHETRTDTQTSLRYSARETGCTNMAARFPREEYRMFAVAQNRQSCHAEVLTVKRLL